MRVFSVFFLMLLSRASSFLQNSSMCPVDSYNLSSCFTYFNHRMNWSQAHNMCQQYGLHLITIQNINEASAIAALVKNYQQNENIWINLEKPSQNSQWKIIHQSRNGQHKPLKAQEGIMEQKVCMELVATEGFLKWNTTDCREKRHFLCQTLPFHSKFWMKESSNVTKLNKLIKINEKNKYYELTKYLGEMREKSMNMRDEETKEPLFTNNYSSKKSLTPFLVVSLVFISLFISLFPEIKSPKQDLKT